MQPTHPGADGYVEGRGDLRVRDTIGVGRPNRYPELDGPGRGRLDPTEATVEVEVLHLLELGLLGAALLGPVGVDERVREYPVEPGLEVRPLLETTKPAVGLQVGLLDEILGVGGVARHAQG